MTKEEAIYFANCLKNNYTVDLNDMEAFCDEVIKALEKEPTNNYLADGCIDKWDIVGKKAEAWIIKGKLQIRSRGSIHNIDLPLITSQEPRWIPVSERLPKIADVYRVTRYYPNNVMNPIYLVDACCFDGYGTWYDDNRINHERAYADNVIAWQENPEPYKVEPQESEEV